MRSSSVTLKQHCLAQALPVDGQEQVTLCIVAVLLWASGVRTVSSTSVTLCGPRKLGNWNLNPDPLIYSGVWSACMYVHHVDIHTVYSHLYRCLVCLHMDIHTVYSHSFWL